MNRSEYLAMLAERSPPRGRAAERRRATLERLLAEAERLLAVPPLTLGPANWQRLTDSVGAFRAVDWRALRAEGTTAALLAMAARYAGPAPAEPAPPAPPADTP